MFIRGIPKAFELLVQKGVLETELAQRLKKSVGFRNLAVHNYEAINWAIAHALATRHLVDFEAFAKAVVEHGLDE